MPYVYVLIFSFIVNSVYSNLSKELQNLNITENENGTSMNKTKKEKYNAYVNAEVQDIWDKYLTEAEVAEFKPFKERTKKWTTVMEKESAVTETIKAFRERAKNTEIEATTNNNFTPKPRAQTFGIGNDRTVNVIRRQATGQKKWQRKDPLEDAIRDQISVTQSKLKFEGYRQPYWAEGDYVFLRTGSPASPGSKDSTNPMEVPFRDCDRTCNYYFKTYGRVCGHRYNTKHWKNEYKNFANICDIDHENCISTRMKPHWHPMYRGNCSELLPFPKMEYDWMDIAKRGRSWAPYVYVPPTTTAPTPDPVDAEIEALQKG